MQRPRRAWLRIRAAPARSSGRLVRWLVLWALRLAVALGCASVLASALPYRATVDGVPFRVQATLVTHSGLSADTTLGSWDFPHVTGVPVGVHLSPVNVDLLRLTRDASPNTSAYVKKLKTDFDGRLPGIALWLAGETAIGIIVGLALCAAVEMAVRYLRRCERRPHELVRVLRQMLAGLGVAAVVAAFGALTYNPHWAKQSRLSGTLAAFQLFPDQLKNYYGQQSKAYDALTSIVGIQAALQDQIEQHTIPATAFNIMFISDVHLAAVYPLVSQYADNFDAKLIVNTGDESEFGSAAELTPAYTDAIAALTKTIPMIWLAGNHDSPEVEAIMASIPGVTVLGRKSTNVDGTISAAASYVHADGLTIAGLPDPRVYGAQGSYGAADGATTDKLEKQAADTATAHVPKSSSFDIFATHEPVAAQRLTHDLPDQIRQTNAGHLHAQNATADIQSGSTINLVEGSTGAGGLDNIGRTQPRPPIEFSIESVAANCDFTKLVRFQLNNAATPTNPDTASFGDDVTVSTLYLKSQHLAKNRECSAAAGISATVSLPG
jgi:predicted MPP superfamily phosphohydrolase